MAKETPYLRTSTAALISAEPSIEALIEKSNASVSKAGDPPIARELHVLHDKIRDTVNRFMNKRGEVCDRSMRQLVQRRKERMQEEREREAARAAAETAKVKREEDERRREKKTPSKKRTAEDMEVDEDDPEIQRKRDSLPNVGAHGLARQDGVGVHEGMLMVRWDNQLASNHRIRVNFACRCATTTLPADSARHCSARPHGRRRLDFGVWRVAGRSAINSPPVRARFRQRPNHGR